MFRLQRRLNYRARLASPRTFFFVNAGDIDLLLARKRLIRDRVTSYVPPGSVAQYTPKHAREAT